MQTEPDQLLPTSSHTESEQFPLQETSEVYKIGKKKDLHLRVIFKKVIFTLRNNGGKVIFDFCRGETTEALFIANS